MSKGRPSKGKSWAPESLTGIRLVFKKNPVAHSTVFLAGKDLPQLIRSAIEEYAINHRLISAEPHIWKKLEAFAFNQFAKNKAATPGEFMQFLAKSEGYIEGGGDLANHDTTQVEVAAIPAPSVSPRVPEVQPMPVAQTPKTRQPIDFGPAETPPPPAPENPAESEQQSTAAEYNRWFKDQDNY